MDNVTFGLTMLLVGMGGTLLTLWLLAILMGGLTRLCQPRAKGVHHE
ncbi:MAG: OadG-related small transporter subunit [Verrucomicrobiota bacterium]